MSHQDTVGNLEFLTTEYLGEKKNQIMDLLGQFPSFLLFD